jgi:hypothetical protein
MATSVQIKQSFKVAYDAFSFNFSNNQLNEIFERAQGIYWGALSDKWGVSLEGGIDLQPLVMEINVVSPGTYSLPLNLIPDYNRIGFLKTTYVVDGITYTFPAKPLPINNKYSMLSSGTVRYPRYYLIDDNIVLEPSINPTNVNIIYIKNYEFIDFNDFITEINITERNVQGIIEQALRICGTSQREFDYTNAVTTENSVSNSL